MGREVAPPVKHKGQYGAHPPRLAITCDITIDKAQELFDGYWKLNCAIKAVAEAQKIKIIEDHGEDEMWLWNPVSKFWYSLRKDNDRFSTLIQGTASYVFDLWIGLVLKEREQLTAQFHDEGVWCVKNEEVDQMYQILERSIMKTNQILKLNRELGIGIQTGSCYSEIH